MRAVISQIETFVINYPVTGHFRFFQNRPGKPAGRRCVVVKIVDEAGNVGWGQSVPSPGWSYETIETVVSTIEHYLAPALIGLDACDITSIEHALDRTIAPGFSTGQPICKAGIDLALFDLTGRLMRESAAGRWGRTAGPDRITLSWTVNPQTLEEVSAILETARERGFHHFNIKVAPDPAFDLAVCGAIRNLAPDACLWVDANGGYDEATALDVAPRFADLGIAAFEQPLRPSRLGGFRRLKKQGALPILMDESIVSVIDLQEFHQLDLLDGVAMKVSRCGGLTESVRILDYMEQNGLLFFASGLTDPDLSLAASLHLFAAYGLTNPAALNAPQFLTGSILKNPVQIVGDQAFVPHGDGLGVEVDETVLRGMEG